MGNSAEAILFYGYAFEYEGYPWNVRPTDDEADEDQDENENWEDRYARLKSLKRPAQPFPPREVPRTRENNYDSTPKDYTADEQAIIDDYSAFWRAKRELAAQEPCEVGAHGYVDESNPFVCIKASRVGATWGERVEIENLNVEPEWNAQLAAFCELMGIKPDGPPKWWMVAYYG